VARTLRVMIGNSAAGYTDYGPAPWGNSALVNLHVENVSRGAIGSGEITLQKAGGGLNLTEKMFVRVFDDSGTYPLSPHVAWWWFWGVISDIETELVKGTNMLRYHLKLQDANVLFDWMGVDPSASPVITDGGVYTFDGQMERIVRTVTRNNTTIGSTFDTSGIVLTSSLSNAATKVFAFEGMNWRAMMDDRMKAYRIDFPTSRPRYWLSAPNFGGIPTDAPLLNVIDDTVTIAGGAGYTLSDAPSGTKRGIFHYSRKRDGIDLGTRVVAVDYKRPGGGIFTATYLSGNRTTYPNDFDARPFAPLGAAVKAWQVEHQKVKDGSADSIVTGTASNVGKSRENASESVTITVMQPDPSDPAPLRPTVPLAIKSGDVVQVELTGEGVNQKYLVSKVEWDWIPGVWFPYPTLTAGNQLLGMGDPTDNENAPVQERDTSVPAPPTSPSMTSSVYNGFNNMAYTTFGLTAPSPMPANVVEYRMHLTVGGRRIPTIRFLPSTPGGAPPTSVTVELPPGATGSGTATSVTGAGIESGPVALPGFTTASAPPYNNLFNPTFALPDVSDPSGSTALGWTKTFAGPDAAGSRMAASSARDIAGQWVHSLSVQSPTDTITILSSKVSIQSSLNSVSGSRIQATVGLTYYAANTRGLLSVDAIWYDHNGSALPGSPLMGGGISPVALVNTPFYKTLNAPTNAVSVAIRARLDYSVGGNVIYVGAVVATPGTIAGSSGSNGADVVGMVKGPSGGISSTGLLLYPMPLYNSAGMIMHNSAGEVIYAWRDLS
jgi:hypothetical protein